VKPIRADELKASASFRASNPNMFKNAGSPVIGKPEAKLMKAKVPNKTEARYAREFLSVNGVVKAQYEGVTFKLAGGSRYTIDWYLFDDGTHIVVEVKNAAYKHASYGRAWTAFREARAQFPGFHFTWAELQKDGTWKERT
jgi:hypothetical protein